MTTTNKNYATIYGRKMAWVESGSGKPIVFLHGNPTSSYLWRNVIPRVEHLGRCIAPDLLGMGDSEKLDEAGKSSYRFVEHRKYLDGLLSHLGLTEDVTLVLHDWGSALGFDWANRNRVAISGIIYMEAIVRPILWDEWPEKSRPIFEAMRSPKGEELVLDRNIFVERILPGSVIRQLSDDEMAEYRRPFLEAGEDRRPTLSWPRQIPIEGDPEDVTQIVKTYGDWLTETLIPKLFINADPGAILVGKQREFCRSWPNQNEITVPGIHFIQEDSADEIGHGIANWIGNLS